MFQSLSRLLMTCKAESVVVGIPFTSCLLPASAKERQEDLRYIQTIKTKRFRNCFFYCSTFKAGKLSRTGLPYPRPKLFYPSSFTCA